jgi:hypothetical protein
MKLARVRGGDLVTIVVGGQQVTVPAYLKSKVKGCWILRGSKGDSRAYFATPENTVHIKYIRR